MGDVQAQSYEENYMLSQYKDLDVRTLLPRQALAETQYLGMTEVEQGQSGAWRAETSILALMVHNVIDHRAVRWIKRDQTHTGDRGRSFETSALRGARVGCQPLSFNICSLSGHGCSRKTGK